jgi:dTDP-4-amino-4,6-dideoxygalactose transaminase
MTELGLSRPRSQTGHPDRAWIARVQSALARWETASPITPTSTVLGGGAIAEAEAVFSRLHENRPALLLPSATYALRAGLQTLGVRAGDEVICPVIDWPAAVAAITSLGATPVPVMVDPQTMTIGAGAAAGARTARTRAVVACHLHGICADVPALRRLLPGIGICEDASQAFGARLGGYLAGTLADVAVLSLGPGKQIDAGEGGVLLCRTAGLYQRAVRAACHPLRNLLMGVRGTEPLALVMRPHPMAAVLALHELAEWSPQPAQAANAALREQLATCRQLAIIGDAARHASTQPYVPVLLHEDDVKPPPGLALVRSGASVLSPRTSKAGRDARALQHRLRMATMLRQLVSG